MILQILARCGAFFIGFIVKGQMNHDFAFRIEVNPCVIEITIGNAIKQTIFEPVRKSVVNNAVRYAFNETTEFTWGPIIRSATYSGLSQLGSEAAISAGQTSLYFYINRWIHSIN